MKKYKNRAEVEDKYKWDLTDYFKDEKEFEKSFNETVKKINELPNYKGKLNDPKILYEFLEKDIHLMAIVERLYIYAYLKNDECLGIKENMERKSKTEDLNNLYFINESFFAPELLKLSKEKYNKLFTLEPKLIEFRKVLDEIYKNKDHILSEKEENMISSLTNAMNHFEDMSSTMLNTLHNYGTIKIDGVVEEITPTNLRKLLKNDNRNIRKKVREKYNQKILEYAALSAKFLNGYVKGNLEISKLHNFKNAWDKHLFNLDINDDCVNALVTTVEDNVSSLQKYFKLFKNTLKLDKLYQYDLNLEMVKSNKEYKIEDAWEICLNALKPLGEDYIKHFKKIIDNRYIDYAQYKGKQSGGYSFSPMDRDSRILLSYNYDLTSISTIIHEGGHNVHSQYMKENNPLQYRDQPNILAEVASLTNECLLSSYLAKYGSNKNEKLAGIENILNVISSNLFGAVREGKIETIFYEYIENGGTITKEYMNDLVSVSLKKYYGKEVILDKYSPLSWISRSHYYMSYYLYSYAFCISVASYIAKEILDGNKEMLNNYLKFLKTGSDIKVMDVFSILGIDLTKKEVYQKAIEYFNKMIDEFKKISEVK